MKYVKLFESLENLDAIQDAFADLSDLYNVTIEDIEGLGYVYSVGIDFPSDISEISKLVKDIETAVLRLRNVSSQHHVEIVDDSIYVYITLDNFHERFNPITKISNVYHINIKEFDKMSEVFGFRKIDFDDDRDPQTKDPFILVSFLGGSPKSVDKIIYYLETKWPEIFSQLIEMNRGDNGHEKYVEWKSNSEFILVIN